MSVKKKTEKLEKVKRSARQTTKGLENMLYSKRVHLAYKNMAKGLSDIICNYIHRKQGWWELQSC